MDYLEVDLNRHKLNLLSDKKVMKEDSLQQKNYRISQILSKAEGKHDNEKRLKKGSGSKQKPQKSNEQAHSLDKQKKITDFFNLKQKTITNDPKPCGDINQVQKLHQIRDISQRLSANQQQVSKVKVDRESMVNLQVKQNIMEKQKDRNIQQQMSQQEGISSDSEFSQIDSLQDNKQIFSKKGKSKMSQKKRRNSSGKQTKLSEYNIKRTEMGKKNKSKNVKTIGRRSQRIYHKNKLKQQEDQQHQKHQEIKHSTPKKQKAHSGKKKRKIPIRQIKSNKQYFQRLLISHVQNSVRDGIYKCYVVKLNTGQRVLINDTNMKEYFPRKLTQFYERTIFRVAKSTYEMNLKF